MTEYEKAMKRIGGVKKEPWDGDIEKGWFGDDRKRPEYKPMRVGGYNDKLAAPGSQEDARMARLMQMMRRK